MGNEKAQAKFREIAGRKSGNWELDWAAYDLSDEYMLLCPESKEHTETGAYVWISATGTAEAGIYQDGMPHAGNGKFIIGWRMKVARDRDTAAKSWLKSLRLERLLSLIFA